MPLSKMVPIGKSYRDLDSATTNEVIAAGIIVSLVLAMGIYLATMWADEKPKKTDATTEATMDAQT
jgi:hypothetical protein